MLLNTLLKTIKQFLLVKDASFPDATHDIDCSLVSNYNTTLEQCQFIIDNDCLSNDSLIDYANLVYCRISLEARVFTVILLGFMLFIYFLALGVIADNCLCPNLLTLSKKLRMSDSLAGVTLLAFGNGCPDIFSSLVAASDGRTELIIGELLGAGIFCTSVVVGFVFIQNQFTVSKYPVLRDASFYSFAVIVTWYYCYTGSITFFRSMIVATSTMSLRPRKKLEEYHSQTCPLNDLSKLKNLEANSTQVKDGNCSISSIFKTCSPPEHVPMPALYRLSISLGSGQSAQLVDLATPHHVISSEPEYVAEQTFKTQENPKLLSSDKNELNGSKESRNKEKERNIVVEQGDEHADDQKSVSCTCQSGNYLYKSFKKVINLFQAPLKIVAKFTVPVAESTDKGYDQILSSVLIITMAPTIILLTGSFNKMEIDSGTRILPLLILMTASLILAILFIKWTNPETPPVFHDFVISFLGFVMSIAWIFRLSTEIISILKIIGLIFGLSDTAIGFGILSWGNSLGDAISNSSLAYAGYPQMAIAASIGSPLLNLLIGFGASFSLKLRNSNSGPQEVKVECSRTISFLCSTLLMILLSIVSYSVSSHSSNNRVRTIFGYSLLIVYGIYFYIAVYLEIHEAS